MRYMVDDEVVLMRAPQGPLAAYMRPFASWLRAQGYGSRPVRQRMWIATDFSAWLSKKGFRLPAISSRLCAPYLRYRSQRLKIHPGDAFALAQLLEFLQGHGLIAAEVGWKRRLVPAERCAEGFERYLREDRALSRATIVYYLPAVREFLNDLFGNGPVNLSALRAADITDHVRSRAKCLHRKRAKMLTSALRSFLRYLRYRGEIRVDLAAAVPTVADWSMPSIPRAIPQDQVRQLLRQIDRDSAVGRRNYAILLLLARLGLRAGEIVSLELDDLDWQAGCLSVHGKSGSRSKLPLPKDVGAALVSYLRHGRPRSASRRVFLCAKAPTRGLGGPAAICTVVRRALLRAGIKAPTMGAHQFRHGLATEMLRRGASLSEIGALLGHRSPETTKIYTKVDLDALRTLALPWPGGAR